MPVALIIEDDPDASELLAEILRRSGWTSRPAFTGREGLRLARETAPGIVFLDVMLPDMNGYEICQELKLDRRTNPIPIVFQSALSAESARARGLSVGAEAYVAKPYSEREIQQAVRDALRHRDAMRGDDLRVSIRFDVASQMENLHSVNDLFGCLLAHIDLSASEAARLRTALLEVGQNAIEWGNRRDAEKLVRIHARVWADRVEVEIQDEGEGFNPSELPHAAGGDDDPAGHFALRELLGLREGGFGMQIVRGLMDEVRYNARGNAVTLVKRLRPDPK